MEHMDHQEAIRQGIERLAAHAERSEKLLKNIDAKLGIMWSDMQDMLKEMKRQTANQEHTIIDLGDIQGAIRDK